MPGRHSAHTLGTYASNGDGTATFERQDFYSCAHPENVNSDDAGGDFRYQFVDDELWVSVSGFGGFAFDDNQEEPTRWLGYRRISRDEYYGKYTIRFCQPHDGYECQPGSSDSSLIDEP